MGHLREAEQLIHIHSYGTDERTEYGAPGRCFRAENVQQHGVLQCFLAEASRKPKFCLASIIQTRPTRFRRNTKKVKHTNKKIRQKTTKQ